MGSESYIAIGVILVIIAGAIIKIVRDKRRGVKCIGCPCSCQDKQLQSSECDRCQYRLNK